MTQDRPKIHPKWILITLLSRWGWKNASTLLRRFHGSYSVFCTSHIPKAAGNMAPKIQKLSSHAGQMALDKPNIALQDLKIKKPPHRVNAHLPLGLYVDAKKNVLVLAHLARNSRIWPYSPPRSQHSPPSGPIRLHMTPDRPNIALKWPNMATWAKISPTYSPPTDPICCRAEHRPEVAQYKPNKIVNCQTKPPTWPWNDAG